MTKKTIRKVVFPVAGLGTRFLPATKASPKEMLPIVDKPLIQYAVEEAVAAGCEQMIFVTSSNKRAIEDHFDKNTSLEDELLAHNKLDLLELVHQIVPQGISCIYLRQPEALGLGHAVLCAQPVVGNEPFAVILADDLIDGSPVCLKQMTDLYEKHPCSIISVEPVPNGQVDKYGVVDPQALYDQVFDIKGVIEKPAPEQAPSNLAIIGRYLLTPEIFNHLKTIPKGAGGEIQLTDAIASLLKQQQVLAYQFTGKRYDCGNKLGYLQATVEFALKHNELKQPFLDYLKNLPHLSD
jgi:UTP--glucose-1-phosphate uridylyltransferase